MNPNPNLHELSEALGNVAADLATVAANLGDLARVEANNFERQAKREIAELVVAVERLR